jgi:hypothetical protein
MGQLKPKNKKMKQFCKFTITKKVRQKKSSKKIPNFYIWFLLHSQTYIEGQLKIYNSYVVYN